MEKQEILERVQAILREHLERDSIVVRPETTAEDVPGWDSLTHVQLVSAIEAAFRIRFSSREVFRWKNVGEMVESIAGKV